MALDDFGALENDLPHRPIHVVLRLDLLKIQEVHGNHIVSPRCKLVGDSLVRFGGEGVVGSTKQDNAHPIRISLYLGEHLLAPPAHVALHRLLHLPGLVEGSPRHPRLCPEFPSQLDQLPLGDIRPFVELKKRLVDGNVSNLLLECRAQNKRFALNQRAEF